MKRAYQLIFARASQGVALSGFLLLAACSSGGSASSGSGSTSDSTLAAGGASSVYVLQEPSSLLQFPAGSDGAIRPTSSLIAQYELTISCVTVDTIGQIYLGLYDASVSANTDAQIQVFAPGSTGTSSPIRVIKLNAAPWSMTVDISGNLYEADFFDDVEVFSSTASGVATPTQFISGFSTTLGSGYAIAVDAARNIYVGTYTGTTTPTGAIAVFSAGATGNAAPIRVISNPNLFTGVALDKSGNIYASINIIQGSSAEPAIVEYSSTANGEATPLKTIEGTATTFERPDRISVDAVGNIYVANWVTSGSTNSYSLLAFGPASSGNVAPGASFTSPEWTAGVGFAIH